MALSNLIDSKTNTSSTVQKIVPWPAENCISPNNCQYWVASKKKCSLGECPFRMPREMTPISDDPQLNADQTRDVINTTRTCCICGGDFTGFVGAVPICPTCMERIKDVIATPHCPGCGKAVSRPHMICESCKAAYLKDEVGD